jgi:hypothetical protein
LEVQIERCGEFVNLLHSDLLNFSRMHIISVISNTYFFVVYRENVVHFLKREPVARGHNPPIG